MTKYDMDIHAMEPVELWPKQWQEQWLDKVEIPVEDYIRQLDKTQCDVGVFLPTRSMFMTGFYTEAYNGWAKAFCDNSNNRLRFVQFWTPGMIKPNDIVIVLPKHLPDLLALDIKTPIIVHSCPGLRYSNSYHVDHALTHPLDAMQLVAYLTTLEFTLPKIAIMECGTWWVPGFVDHLKREKLDTSKLNNLYIGASVDDGSYLSDNLHFRYLFGSDFPHYDTEDLTKATPYQRNVGWNNASKFMEGI